MNEKNCLLTRADVLQIEMNFLSFQESEPESYKATSEGNIKRINLCRRHAVVQAVGNANKTCKIQILVMLPCFTFTHKSKFTYSRTKIFNFTFSRQDPCFTHSRVKKFHFTFSRQKKGSRVHTKRFEPWHTKEFFSQILNLFTPKWQFYNTSNLKKILFRPTMVGNFLRKFISFHVSPP